MGIASILKIIGFLLWPVLLLALYYVASPEGFKRRLKDIMRKE